MKADSFHSSRLLTPRLLLCNARLWPTIRTRSAWLTRRTSTDRSLGSLAYPHSTCNRTLPVHLVPARRHLRCSAATRCRAPRLFDNRLHQSSSGAFTCAPTGFCAFLFSAEALFAGMKTSRSSRLVCSATASALLRHANTAALRHPRARRLYTQQKMWKPGGSP
ncbi:hypothetical protein BJY59DRAFT_189078 [Rhodotorula toruloides]